MHLNKIMIDIVFILIFLAPLSWKIWATLSLPKQHKNGEVDRSGLNYAMFHSTSFLIGGIIVINTQISETPINLIFIALSLIYAVTGLWGIIQVIRCYRKG